MKTIWFWQFNIRTASESNSFEHWTVKAARHKDQKQKISKVLSKEKPPITPPCTCILTRISPRMLDDYDNLPMAFKWIRDAVAEYLIPGKKPGRADDSKEIIWKYDQRKGGVREYAITLELIKDD